MELDYGKIKAAAESYKKEMSAFLRAMISYPSESCEEKEVVMCIKKEMEKVPVLEMVHLFLALWAQCG